MSRVAFLGPEGTFTHEALEAALVGPATLVASASIHEAVLAVEHAEAEMAFVPVENSIGGAVAPTLDALTFEARGVVVVGEWVQLIHHALLAGPGTEALTDVREVRSHPQALAQCAAWLRDHVPGATVTSTASTAGAVREASVEPGVAAVASRGAGERYGARVLADGIEDQAGNATRFWWLHLLDDELPTGPGVKSSVVFHGAGDRSAGWLVRCLSEFAFRGVNLTRIESRPLRSQLGHYAFHVDCDGSAADGPVSEALAALHGHCTDVRLLGSYRAAPRPADAA